MTPVYEEFMVLLTKLKENLDRISFRNFIDSISGYGTIDERALEEVKNKLDSLEGDE